MTKVAIFETDHAFAVELRNELTRFGCTVQVFTDGTSGLTAAKSTPPDLILVSAELPPVNGFSTCNKIKKDAKLASVPIILMSSQSSPETFEQHRRLPSRADDYVHKPISFADFLPHIRQLITLVDPGHGIVDEDTSMVMDEEVLIVEDSAFDAPSFDEPAFDPASDSGDAPPEAKPSNSRRPTLELEIGEQVGPDGIARRAMGPKGELETMDEDLQTVVGERPSIPEHLLEAYRAAKGPGSGPASATVPQPPPGAPQRRASVPPSGPQTGPPRPSHAPGAFRSTPPGAAAPADLTRAKNALQSALSQLNQARKETSTLREKLAAAQAGGSDVQRLRADLEKAKSAERDVLDLREQLQARDRELVTLRESFASKEREVLSARDGTLTIERAMAELKDQLGKVETEKGAAKAALDALTADKALADKRAEDFKTGARKIAEQLNQRAKELTDANTAHDAAVERLKREHKTKLDQLETERRKELAEVETSHREQLERVKSQTAKKAGKAEESTKAEADRIAEEKAAVETKLAELEKKSSAELAEQKKAIEAANKSLAETKKLAEAAEKALADANKAHGAELEKLRAAVAAAEKATEELRTSTDAAKQSANETQKEQAKRDAERDQAHAAELSKAAEAHKLVVDELVAGHARELAKLEQAVANATHLQQSIEKENADALQKAGYDYQEKLLQKEQSLASLKEQLEKELEESNAENDDLKKQVATLEEAALEERKEHDDKVATLTVERDDLVASLTKERDELSAAVARLQPMADKLEKARIRWGEDRSELKQVKNTLAGLVRTLDEAMVKDLEAD